MKEVKKVVLGLSVVCIIFVVFCLLTVLPMIFGSYPTGVTTDAFQDDFPKNSLVFYQPADKFPVENGYYIVYNGSQIGIFESAENGVANIQNGGNTNTNIEENTINGTPYELFIPGVGAIFNFIKSNLYIFVFVGIILAMRIVFIFYDPTAKEKHTDEFEEAMNNLGNDEKEKDFDATAIFGINESEKEDEDLTKRIVIAEKAEDAEDGDDREDKTVEISAAYVNTDKTADIPTDTTYEMTTVIPTQKEQAEQTDIDGYSGELIQYIDDLVFDAHRNRYDADQVDAALDEITARCKKLVTLAKNSASKEAPDTDTDAGSEKLKEELKECRERLDLYEQKIEAYKVMEVKVEQLLKKLGNDGE